MALNKADFVGSGFAERPLTRVIEGITGPYTIFFFYFRFACLRAVYNYQFLFFTEEPDRVARFDQQLSIFSISIWMSIIGVFLVMTVIFKIIHYLYSTKIGIGHNLAGKVTHPFDFFILTVGALTEPDPIPWFPKYSTGERYAHISLLCHVYFDTHEIK